MLFLATRSDGCPVPVRDVAEALKIPAPSLAKTVQVLTRSGLMSSQKGPGGGLLLGRSPDDLTLLEVVQAIEGEQLTRECVIGIPGCSEDTTHCPFHERWGKIYGKVLSMLGERSIAQVAVQVKRQKHVLAGIAGASS